MIRSALVALLCMVSLTMYCQNAGIYYTRNGAKLNGDKPKGFTIAYDHGFALGAFLDLTIAPDVELSIQPGYQKLQSIIKIPDTGNPDNDLKDTLDFQLDYLSVPLLFKIHPVKSERVYFIAGPQIGFLLDGKTTNENGEEKDQNDLLNDFNLSLNFGLGYKFPVKSIFLLLEVRYEQGLLNITDYGNPDELFSRVKTQGVNFSLGFFIPFKRAADE